MHHQIMIFKPLNRRMITLFVASLQRRPGKHCINIVLNVVMSSFWMSTPCGFNNAKATMLSCDVIWFSALYS